MAIDYEQASRTYDDTRAADEETIELMGLEPSDAMRAIARSKNPSLRTEEGDHSRIPFAESSLDFVYMTDVIHHVRDLDLLFEGLRRKLVPGGLVCVVTESWEQIGARWYNAYFPSLAANEKSRYPGLSHIEAAAAGAGLSSLGVEIGHSIGNRVADAAFIRLVEEKNYSMFRLFGEAEYEAGLAALRADEGRIFEL
jgi:SAM-dependent methyltransferase